MTNFIMTTQNGLMSMRLGMTNCHMIFFEEVLSVKLFLNKMPLVNTRLFLILSKDFISADLSCRVSLVQLIRFHQMNNSGQTGISSCNLNQSSEGSLESKINSLGTISGLLEIDSIKLDLDLAPVIMHSLYECPYFQYQLYQYHQNFWP